MFVDIQGVFFNWSYPKNHKYGKKLKYQNWSYPKIHKYGKKLKYQNWSSPKIHKYQNWSPLIKTKQEQLCLIKGKPRTTVDPAPDHAENRLPAQLSSLKPNMVVTS